jgi:2-dehydro-3-deoxy-D-arabinonate dehydratase
MKLAAVWSPAAARGVVCVVVDGDLLPVGGQETYSDVSELLARWGGTIEGAADAAGVPAGSLGRYDDLATGEPSPGVLHLVAPVIPAEVWAAGVTYERSRDARMYESDERDVYERVYEAERPELFLKATGARVVGPGAPIGLRSDSEWQIPEPEIGLVLGTDGEVLGYTLGNDVSSRDIEGDNPLYLPQAKIFAGSCAIGPCVVTAAAVEDPYALGIDMRIVREGRVVVEGSTTTARLHKRFETLTDHLRRDNWIAPGTVLLTGTGIVPPDDFTLAAGDVVEIVCDPIGTLRNRCRPAAELPPPADWTAR